MTFNHAVYNHKALTKVHLEKLNKNNKILE